MIPALLGILAFGVLCLLYASLVERNWFALRVHRVPCLPKGSPPIRILHISTHLIGKSVVLPAIGGALDRVGPLMLTRQAINDLKSGPSLRSA